MSKFSSQGNRLSRVDAHTRTTAYRYDELNRLIQVTAPDTTVVSLTLDPVGHLTAVGDSTGTMTATYDALNRLIRKVYPDATTLDSAYDATGNRIALSVTGMGATTLTYDAANRLTTLTAPGSLVTRFGYDARSRRTSLTDPNGVATTDTYDLANRLTSATAQKGATVVAQDTYTYNADGQRTQQTFTHGPTTGSLTYAYDALNQLTQETGTVAGVSLTNSYTYDAVGNRTQLTQNGVARTSTYTTLNQVLSESSPVVTYAYDATGNRIKRQSATLTETLGYDVDQRLKTYVAGSTTTTYTYNGLGERVKKAVGATVTTSYLDGAEVVLEKTGTSTTFYLHGPGIDDLIGRKVGVTWTYYHQDALGSVAALTDSTGVVLRSYAYEPFGSVRKTTGTTANVWTFTGRPLDAESGVLFLRNRYYDSRTGTFLSQDPIGIAGGVNLYAYVRNNPVSSIDPLGLSGWLYIHSREDDPNNVLDGHSWMEYRNDNGEVTTYGTWGNEHGGQGVQGLNVNSPSELGHVGSAVRATYSNDAQEGALSGYVKEVTAEAWNGGWSVFCPCSSFATRAWGKVTGEYLNDRNGLGISNPDSLANSIRQANGGQGFGTLSPSNVPAESSSTSGRK